MSKPVILTGLRANNDLHIGNYFGALLPLIDMAKNKAGEYQVNLFVPDLHSFTTPIDHSLLQASINNNLRTYAASGLPLDNPDVFLYRQSYVSAHSELTLILDCFTGMGEMGRMTQYKDKSSALDSDRVSVGLFNYPVLMAADILLYSASYVPVGEDQSQHLEFTRDIAGRLNNRFGELFTVPEPVKQQHAFFGKDQGLRIKDLVNPEKKMSKSDESGKGVVFMNEDPESAKKKIMGATTDSLAKITYDKANQPGLANLMEIMALVSGISLDEVINKYQGQTSYGPFKQELADQLANFLANFQTAYKDVDEQALSNKLSESEAKMNEQANQTLTKVQRAVGFKKLSDKEEVQNERLDQYLSRTLNFSRSYSVTLIKEGSISVDKETQTKPSYKVNQTDKVKVLKSLKQDQVIPSIDLPVVYEDKNCVVINKPVGVLTHSKGEFNPEATVATWLEERVPAMRGNRAGIVHRLDRATSGIMIVAKTPEALKHLQKQFSLRRTKKTYKAIIEGHLSQEEAVIDMPIERNPKKPQAFRVGINGKPSTTHYKVLKSNNGYALLELKPVTGRTHQLRVHLRQLGHPIVGDTLYGGKIAPRLYLHAESLEITLPDSKREVFEAKTPKEFDQLLK